MASKPALRIGFTGHRWTKLNAQASGAVQAALAQGFAALELDGQDVVLMSGMAEGSDMLAARARPMGWRLNPVLALPLEAWRTHLTQPPARVPEDLALFDELMREAEAPIIAPNDGAANYDWVGQLIAETCDHLVSVWNGRPGQPGGTAWVISQAQARGVPVTVLCDKNWEAA